MKYLCSLWFSYDVWRLGSVESVKYFEHFDVALVKVLKLPNTSIIDGIKVD